MSEVVVITGAGAGAGRATARAFAARGCSVALCPGESMPSKERRRTWRPPEGGR